MTLRSDILARFKGEGGAAPLLSPRPDSVARLAS